jgi:hypothetical protein
METLSPFFALKEKVFWVTLTGFFIFGPGLGAYLFQVTPK